MATSRLSEQEQDEQMARLCEDIRRALNAREFVKATRYVQRLREEFGMEFFTVLQEWPVCLECNGYAEVVDPEHPERKVMCASAPSVCLGTQGGRMSPGQYADYLERNLSPLRPTRTESVPKADADGNVPRRPPDDMKPFTG